MDVEGKQLGIDEELVALLGRSSPVPVTYAGGARTLASSASPLEFHLTAASWRGASSNNEAPCPFYRRPFIATTLCQKLWADRRCVKHRRIWRGCLLLALGGSTSLSAAR